MKTRTGCRAREAGVVKYKGRASLEFTHNGKKYYYCEGWIDCMNDELINYCKTCKRHASRAQEDWERLMKEEG